MVGESRRVDVVTTSKEPGMGDEFIPPLSLAQGSETAGTSSEPRAIPESSSKHASRILVIDDNVDLANGLARLLRILGHHVQVAYDGPSGLDKAKELNPEFILLDIGLPGMDGYQAAAHIRREEGTKSAMIVAISGYGEEEDRRRAEQAGFNHYLVKPIAFEDLIEILSK